MSRLLDAAGDAAFVFVVGKGGVGKTTTAGALALESADGGVDTHLISTDPAHSLGDLFQQPLRGGVAASACSPHLSLEELDAARTADEWLGRALDPVTELVERGTYLDASDVRAFTRLALPGIDEMMAVLRLADLAGGERRVIVDTAPTGHTLRLLDAASAHEAIARALQAMADKAAAVAGALTGRAVRLRGQDIIDQLEHRVAVYRRDVLQAARFVIATRAGAVVEAETERLMEQLERRGLRIAVLLSVGSGGPAGVPEGAVHLRVPVLDGVAGCDGLRTWRDQVQDGRSTLSGPGPQQHPHSGPGPGAADWLARTAPRLLLFAGKGGVGKSTCAAAAALVLAKTRDVLLCSTDPAGSLSDVLGSTGERPVARLRVMQIDPAAPLRRLRDSYQDEIVAALDRLGLSESAGLDRRVIEALWDLAPPGLDELAATSAMLGAAQAQETLVIDSAPTGHFLRLLDMPEIALGWTRQLMRVIVKYGIAGAADGAAGSLLELSRELRALRDSLHDAQSAAVIVVTMAEPMVRAETARLIGSLDAAHIGICAVLVNRYQQATQSSRDEVRAHGTLIYAPDLDRAPVGEDALRGFIDTWNIVT